MSHPVVGLLLAAGQSHRFGSNKLLHPMNDGAPMVVLAAQHLCAALPASIAVVDPDMPEVTNQLEQMGMQIVFNPNAQAGIGSSIACGVRASQQAAGWIIALGDMPYIKEQTITQLVNQLKQQASIVAPVYQQQRGHPVGFGQKYRNELQQLNTDTGARSIIAKHESELQLIETDDHGVIADIDCTEDL